MPQPQFRQPGIPGRLNYPIPRGGALHRLVKRRDEKGLWEETGSVRRPVSIDWKKPPR